MFEAICQSASANPFEQVENAVKSSTKISGGPATVISVGAELATLLQFSDKLHVVATLSNKLYS